MKRVRFFLFILVLMCACSQNNGHIGPIYGAWSLTEMTCDGQPLPIQGHGTVFSFQNSVVQITHHLDMAYTIAKNFGNFTLEGKRITFVFREGVSNDQGYQYTSPAWLHFPSDGQPITMNIIHLNATILDMEMVATDGCHYIYSFRKTW